MIPNDVTIRPITRDELPCWWEMRLRALRDHPDAFGSDYETARQRGPGYLVERNFGPDSGINVILAAFDADDTLLGTAGVFGDTGKRAHIAHVWGVYTVPEARGQGIASRLIDAALNHCRAYAGVLQAHISVNVDNAGALHVYTAAGFVPWGTEPRAIALPGRFDDEIHLALMLDGE
jgi:RimJ/RimL family protein N-acetyltransferase